jgi:hypothetical protein
MSGIEHDEPASRPVLSHLAREAVDYIGERTTFTNPDRAKAERILGGWPRVADLTDDERTSVLAWFDA